MNTYKVTFIDQKPFEIRASGFQWNAEPNRVVFFVKTLNGASHENMAVLNGERVESVVKTNG